MSNVLKTIQEATNKVIELHEDDPEHFKILLKFIYTNSYDKETISKLAADDKVQCILMPIGIYKVADKYNISRIYELVTKDIQDVLTNTIDDNFEILQAAIHAHYGSGATVDNLLGKLITSVVLNMHTTFTTMPAFEGMIQLYPMFGADVALAMTRRNQGCFIKMVSYTCKDCFETSHIDFGRLRSIGHKYFHCSTCGNDVPVGFLPSST
jgi:hypothetical protein